jgi:hypothetical protein
VGVGKHGTMQRSEAGWEAASTWVRFAATAERLAARAPAALPCACGAPRPSHLYTSTFSVTASGVRRISGAVQGRVPRWLLTPLTYVCSFCSQGQQQQGGTARESAAQTKH